MSGCVDARPEVPGETESRLAFTPAALELIERLWAMHGPLMFHQSGGCCDGSAPMCYQLGEFKTGGQDVLLGTLELPAPAGLPAPQDRTGTAGTGSSAGTAGSAGAGGIAPEAASETGGPGGAPESATGSASASGSGSGREIEFWMSREQFGVWAHTHLTVDAVPGRGSGFSLEAPEGLRFLIRSRLLGVPDASGEH
ncbi:DUF779 domain-containing protein [Leucobacter edaphi]|uniref:DUF779 domain-containing protein n=1 Tax=Leucobacter edaphi TaxID=2796472 RepID=UPI003F70C6F2